MKKKKNSYALSSIRKPDLVDDQWFPKIPAKPATKWSFLIGLLDELAIIILVVLILYLIFA
ncbi:MAG: hypothetical protein ACC656_06635 [Candidatus Heimdallarchaeota archaeon]